MTAVFVCMYSLPGDLVPPDSQDRPQMLVLLKSASVGKRKRKAVPREAPQAIPEDVLGLPLVRAFTVGLPCGLFCFFDKTTAAWLSCCCRQHLPKDRHMKTGLERNQAVCMYLNAFACPD